MKRVGDDHRVLNFDQGVSSVRFARDVPRLPDEGQAPAADTRRLEQLEALFESRGVDELLDAATLPEIGDRAVLDPAHFGAALGMAQDAMLRLATAAEGTTRATFAAALEALEGAEGDRAVMEAARRALLRG